MKIQVQGPGPTVFDEVGGRPWFDALAERFYARVEADPLLAPLHDVDIEVTKAHTAGFLAQYWGGGQAQYSDEHGHPRLRMRHAHVRIGPAEREAWLAHMLASVREAELPPELEARFVEYFEQASAHLQNTEE